MTARSHSRHNRRPVRRRTIRQQPGIAGLRLPEYRAPKASTLPVPAAENPATTKRETA